ncbi:MAG: hypothetical protein A4E67_01150 [Syntrophaceae bacterium PtaB.Bin038]|nr:MAG: hypothetical protein A4E67_01150 [Syntrophaceae bacterium PtaB.Bin038]
MLCTMASPRPLPPSRVLKKGSKIRFRSSSGIPGPVSAKRSSMLLSMPGVSAGSQCRRVSKTSSPPPRMAWTALRMTLRNTCFRSSPSARTTGSPSASRTRSRMSSFSRISPEKRRMSRRMSWMRRVRNCGSGLRVKSSRLAILLSTLRTEWRIRAARSRLFWSAVPFRSSDADRAILPRGLRTSWAMLAAISPMAANFSLRLAISSSFSTRVTSSRMCTVPRSPPSRAFTADVRTSRMFSPRRTRRRPRNSPGSAAPGRNPVRRPAQPFIIVTRPRRSVTMTPVVRLSRMVSR